jgi:phage shock protein E
VFDPPVLPFGREIKKKGGAIAKSYQDLVFETMAETEQTDVQTVHDSLESGEDLTVLDVREPGEWEEAHIPQVKHLPRDLLKYQAEDEQLPNKDARIVIHCASGGRSALAAKSLKEMGYTNVANMEGGINAWREKGYETE